LPFAGSGKVGFRGDEFNLPLKIEVRIRAGLTGAGGAKADTL
jgi:hypothetical protein